MAKRLKSILVLIFIITMFSSSAFGTGQPLRVNQEDLIYFIMTDRFHDGDKTNNHNVKKESLSSYHGGDLQGIIDKLDYIKDLGFTAIWITPIVENQPAGYHGYWTTDFYKTNENFGDMDKFKELVQKAHAKDMKVILDLVVNHTGHLHPWVGEPEYEDWFHDWGNIYDYNNQEEVEQGRLASLPDLKQENPKVRKYLIDMAKWWIRETGIDGYRLDTVRHVPKDFWVEFTQEIKKEFPGFYFLGEVFDGRVDYVGDYQKTGIDGLVDFPMYFAINDVFAGMAPAERLIEAIERSSSYQDRHLMGTFIDNHDVPRFVSQITAFRDERLKQAITFMMTYTGVPVMYYGTEIGLDGGADPDNRRDMDWSAKSPITDYVKRLASIRKSSKVLKYGDIKVISSGDDFLAYSRTYDNRTILVAYNLSDNLRNSSLDVSTGSYLKDTLTAKNISVKNNKAQFAIEPRGVRVFSVENSSPKAFLIAVSAVLVLLTGGLGLGAVRRKRISSN